MCWTRDCYSIAFFHCAMKEIFFLPLSEERNSPIFQLFHEYFVYFMSFWNVSGVFHRTKYYFSNHALFLPYTELKSAHFQTFTCFPVGLACSLSISGKTGCKTWLCTNWELYMLSNTMFIFGFQSSVRLPSGREGNSPIYIYYLMYWYVPHFDLSGVRHLSDNPRILIGRYKRAP